MESEWGARVCILRGLERLWKRAALKGRVRAPFLEKRPLGPERGDRTQGLKAPFFAFWTRA